MRLLSFVPLTLSSIVVADHATASGPSASQPLGSLSQLSQQHPLSEVEPATTLGFDAMDELRQALDVMQTTWYALWAGTWPTGIDWTRAVLDTHLIATAASLGRAFDQSRCEHCTDFDNEINRLFGQNIAYYFGEDAFSIRTQAYDDMLWVVLGWLESIRLINAQSLRHQRQNNLSTSPPWHGGQFIPTFAHRAESFWNLTTKGWDTHFCGGGMVWNPRLAPYKNAITNQLFISASVGMYLYSPGGHAHSSSAGSNPDSGRFNPRHLAFAIDGYNWLANSGMTNHKGLYVDGFHVRNWRDGGTECNVRNEMVYTYNQGVLLSGLRGLWESTGNETYLEDGHALARNAIRATGWAFNSDTEPSEPGEWAGLGRDGILEDRCDASGTCNQDAQSFKGIFMHHLALLCEPLPLEPVAPGKTFAADEDLAFLHDFACEQYAKWVRHNAKAAMGTRDGRERFGGWWGASRGSEEVPFLPGAADYRNNKSVLLQDLWTLHITAGVDDTDTQARLGSAHDNFLSTRDLNDRGRGRTVETQSGGVAVLRAFWELSNTKSRK